MSLCRSSSGHEAGARSHSDDEARRSATLEEVARDELADAVPGLRVLLGPGLVGEPDQLAALSCLEALGVAAQPLRCLLREIGGDATRGPLVQREAARVAETNFRPCRSDSI